MRQFLLFKDGLLKLCNQVKLVLNKTFGGAKLLVSMLNLCGRFIEDGFFREEVKDKADVIADVLIVLYRWTCLEIKLVE